MRRKVQNFVLLILFMVRPPPPTPTRKGKPIEQSAVDFLVEQAKVNPGKVTVVALGPLTNIALIFGDPDAADIVFTSGADIFCYGNKCYPSSCLDRCLSRKAGKAKWKVELKVDKITKEATEESNVSVAKSISPVDKGEDKCAIANGRYLRDFEV